MLSEPTTLPHVVQLLLTFDPGLVERVVTLLNIIVKVGVNWKLHLQVVLGERPLQHWGVVGLAGCSSHKAHVCRVKARPTQVL